MSILYRLWADDIGGVVTAEYLMVMGVATAGAVTGAAAIRDATTAGFRKLGDSVQYAVPDPEQTRRLLAPPEPAPAARPTPAAVVPCLLLPPAP